jgi:N-methylhydantoinase A/oxoprolinase/acetone carboxylase beta subunit
VAVDVGGTSSDISLIIKGNFGYEVDPHIAGVGVSLPAVSLHSAALGCGSIARLADGEIRVGPDSAGAHPGPASFGLGGQHATVTDAACCLGYFDPANFLGGRRLLNLDAARTIMQSEIAAPLSLSVEDAAWRVVEKAAALVAASIQGQVAQKNLKVEDCVLFATGGGGGILGQEVARQLGVAQLFAFPVNPVFSAFGLSGLDILHTYEAFPLADGIEDDIAVMRRAATADILGEGLDPAEVDWRLEGEFEDGDAVKVVDFGNDSQAVAKALRSSERVFRLIRLLVAAPGRGSKLQKIGAAAGASVSTASRRIYWSGVERDTRLLDWTKLAEGTMVDGPAVLETSETTLVIPPGLQGLIGPMGEVRMNISVGGTRSAELGTTTKEAVHQGI